MNDSFSGMVSQLASSDIALVLLSVLLGLLIGLLVAGNKQPPRRLITPEQREDIVRRRY